MSEPFIIDNAKRAEKVHWKTKQILHADRLKQKQKSNRLFERWVMRYERWVMRDGRGDWLFTVKWKGGVID
jgi:hypothetical protein